jgi:hypothetical protein
MLPLRLADGEAAFDLESNTKKKCNGSEHRCYEHTIIISQPQEIRGRSGENDCYELKYSDHK